METPDVDRKEVRRPMNAFLIFCKRHRTMVREKNPHLDNRSVTRILGDLWANLQEEEKSQYTDLAKQYKDAFMKANPDYKWHNPDRLANCPTGKPITRPSNIRYGRDESELHLEGSITPGKLADPSNMGGLSTLLMDKPAYIDSHKLTKSATAGTPQSSITSLMDLAMMCSSELSEDQIPSHHHGDSVDPSNRGLDLTTKRENSIDNEEVRNVISPGESRDPDRGWSNMKDRGGGLTSGGDTDMEWGNNRDRDTGMGSSGDAEMGWGNIRDRDGGVGPRGDAKMGWGNNRDRDTGMGSSGDTEMGWGNIRDRDGGMGHRGDKLVIKREDRSDDRKSGQVMMDNIIDKLYTDVPPSDHVGTDTLKTEVPVPTSSSPADVVGLSGTRPKGSTNGAQHIPGFASFLMKKSTKYNVNDEFVRGDGFSGRKRCYSETSVDMYAGNVKLHQMLTDNGMEGSADQSADQEYGEGEMTEDGLHPVRKSKRRNRGQRYQELINEGIIQPSKERLAVIKVETETGRNEHDSSEEEAVPRPLGDLGFDVLSVYPRQIRKRTCSESEKTRSLQEDMQRYKTGDFDLEAHIATLPACSLEKVSRNSKRPAGKIRSMSESCGRSPSVTDAASPATAVPEVVLTVPPHLKPNKQAEPVTGSQRRKARKHSVTHLQIVRRPHSVDEKTSEETNTLKKLETLSPMHAGSRPTENVSCDPQQDVIKSDMSKLKINDQTEDVGQRSDVNVSERMNTLSGRGDSMSACNMIDNILVSLADTKDATSHNIVNDNRETVLCPKETQVNYMQSLLHKSVAVSPPSQKISTETAVTSLSSQMISIETAAISSSPQIISMDVSSSLTKSDTPGLDYDSGCFTSLKTPAAGCILSTESNNTTAFVSSVVSSATQARGNNFSQFDNSSSDESSKDMNSDDVPSVHASITMATTSPGGGPFISEVPCVAGQEYKVNPPQQVAVVNS